MSHTEASPPRLWLLPPPPAIADAADHACVFDRPSRRTRHPHRQSRPRPRPCRLAAERHAHCQWRPTESACLHPTPPIPHPPPTAPAPSATRTRRPSRVGHSASRGLHLSGVARPKSRARAALELRPTPGLLLRVTLAVEGGGEGGKAVGPRACAPLRSQQAGGRCKGVGGGGGGLVAVLVRSHPYAHQGPTIERHGRRDAGRSRWAQRTSWSGDVGRAIDRSPPQLSQSSPPPEPAQPPLSLPLPRLPSTQPIPKKAATVSC